MPLIVISVCELFGDWTGKYALTRICLKGQIFICIGRILSSSRIEVSPCLPAFRVVSSPELSEGECHFIFSPLSVGNDNLRCFDKVIRIFNIAGYRLFTGLGLPGYVRKFDGKIRELVIEPTPVDNPDGRYAS